MKVVAAAMLALALPASAAAALEVKLSVAPETPRKGAATVVQLRPYWTYQRADGTCCVLKPASVNYPFRVQAVSPSGRVYPVAVRSQEPVPLVGARSASAPLGAGRSAHRSGARAIAGTTEPGRGSR